MLTRVGYILKRDKKNKEFYMYKQINVCNKITISKDYKHLTTETQNEALKKKKSI